MRKNGRMRMRTRIEKRPLWAKLVVMLLSSLLAGTVSLRLLAAPPALSELSTGGKSSLVFPGRDGRLVYKTDGDGNRICDFSYAGYKGGGVAIPDVRVEATVAPSGRDDTGSIQQAVDRVGAMPVDDAGFRGAVLLKRGKYTVTKTIHLRHSGVVVRGEGEIPGGVHSVEFALEFTFSGQ